MQHTKNKLFRSSYQKIEIKSQILQGFTLVELIVVVTILAILSTIGFVSYSSYLTGVRDTNRVAQLVSIHDGLELYRTKNDLPLPDSNISIVNGTDAIAYQGYAGANTLETIDFTKGGKDPKNDTYFSYYLTQDRKYFQLMAFLEDDINSTTQAPIFPSPLRRGLGGAMVHAVDYSSRIPTIYGKKLGILTDTNNTPIQEISSVQANGSLDISATTEIYIAHLSDEVSYSGDNTVLSILEQIAKIGGGIPKDCASIKRADANQTSGIFNINPNGTESISAYCDMETDGGGWTLIFKARNGDNGSFSSADSGTCDLWDNSTNNLCRQKSKVSFSEIMIAAFKNQGTTSGSEYRSIIKNVEQPIINYFQNGINDGAYYIMTNPESDFISSINGYSPFDHTPNRIYFSSGFYFNHDDGGGHASILINTHSNADADRVVANGDTTSDTVSIIGLFVK